MFGRSASSEAVPRDQGACTAAEVPAQTERASSFSYKCLVTRIVSVVERIAAHAILTRSSRPAVDGRISNGSNAISTKSL